MKRSLIIKFIVLIGLSFSNTYYSKADLSESYFMERWEEIESKAEYKKNEMEELLNNNKEGNEKEYLSRAYEYLLEKGRESEIIMLSTKALKINQSFLGYFMRCYAYIDLDNNKAKRDCSNAIQLNKKSASAYNNRGVAQDKLGSYYEAISDFDRAIYLDTELAVAYWNIFISKLKVGQRKSGCDDVKKSAYLGSSLALNWIESNSGSWCRNMR
tara:strand:- start:46 stop:687 length:642 start_codon:yes stop_codon:yes gene_type:complete